MALGFADAATVEQKLQQNKWFALSNLWNISKCQAFAVQWHIFSFFDLFLVIIPQLDHASVSLVLGHIDHQWCCRDY